MKLSPYGLSLVVLVCTMAWSPPINAQTILQQRGIDSRVDYRSLTRFGPWDDRNYQLTLEDLAELRPDEARFTDPIPAFYRVGVRRFWRSRQEGGIEYYPLSALPAFRRNFGGYLVEGQLYRQATFEAGRFRVDLSRPVISHQDFLAMKAFGGEVRINVDAAESAIKINPSDQDLVIAGSNGPGGNEMHFSSDGGASWGETSLPLGGTCCDPTVDWKSDGSLAHTATLGNCGFFTGCDIWYYRSSDGGQTWTDLESDTPGDPRREVATGQTHDKEFIHVDKSPTSSHRDNVYLSWHAANVLRLGRSTDDGDTWSVSVHSGDPQGIGSDVVTDKAGAVYHFYPSLEGEGSSRILLKKSTDGGATFAAGVTTVANLENEFNFHIPINETRGVATVLGADADLSAGPFGDSIYVAWTDTTALDTGVASTNHARIQVARSRDGGGTWNTATPHGTADANSVDRFHPWVAVGPDGVVWLAFYETLPADRQQLDFVYTRSTDGGVTWDATQPLTTMVSPNPGDSFEWGDYNGLDVAGDQLIAIFTDNRNEGGGGGDSIDVYAAGLDVGGPSEDEIFSDGFASGNTLAWSSTFP